MQLAADQDLSLILSTDATADDDQDAFAFGEPGHKTMWSDPSQN
jgi:hypothetical protein